MDKAIIEQSIKDLAEELYEGTQKFYKRSLLSVVAYKIWLARKIISSPL